MIGQCYFTVNFGLRMVPCPKFAPDPSMLRLPNFTFRLGLPMILGFIVAMAGDVRGQCGAVINTFPYGEGFESGPAWASGGVGNDWAWGTPAHPLINTAGAGTKAWCVGGLSGTYYNSNERSWLESPCFDFSALAAPRISFQIFWEVERQYDGLVLQYSTDGGATYSNVGSFGEPPDCNTENWFNSANITNLPASINPKHGWSGRVGITQGSCMGGSGSQNWVTAKHCLAWLAYEPSVRFRFFFGAGSTCNNYDGVAIDDILIDEGTPVTAAFTADCTGTTLDFINAASPCPNSFSWDFGENGSPLNTSNLEHPSHTYAAPGTYTVSLTATDACGMSATVSQTISVLAVEIAAIQPTCGLPNGSLEAEVSGANGPVNFYWSPGGATTATLANAGPGDYTVTVTAANSCAAAATATLNASTGSLAVEVAHTDISCHSFTDGTATAVVTGGIAPTVLAWSQGGSQAPAINGLGPGWILCTVTDAEGCTALDSALVQDPPLLVADAGPDTAICAGSTLLLEAASTGGTGPPAYVWSPQGPLISPAATSYFTVVATDAAGCASAPDSVRVEVLAAFQPSVAVSDSLGCTPLCVSFSAQPGDAAAYAWDFGDGGTADSVAPLHCFTSGGSFTVSLTVTDSAGCSGNAMLPGLVQAWASPVVLFSASPTVTTTDEPLVQFLNHSTGAVHYHWLFGNAGQSSSSEESPAFAFDSVACYTVTLEATGPEGCTAADSAQLCVEDPFAIYVPNTFTPNGDGINDVLRPFTTVRDPANYQLLVHDRWGRPFFSTNELHTGWSGQDAADGLYIWTVWITDSMGDRQERRGHVLLLR
ncbi:MAG: PKD domain-containing protein [Flavobacteriales bacterium]|nr:PKD domain-containing protein [Flavobacteriales bacterium]